jgi:hemerythrin-like domain-containing protein
MQAATGNYKLRACDVLFREHATVKAELAKLEPALRAGSAAAAFASASSGLVRVLEKELPPHFAKEEEALFPVMESVTGEGFPPIEVMKAEHRFLIDHFTGLREAAAMMAMHPSGPEARVTALQHLRPLVATLDDHIIKEDSVLLVMAADRLEAPHDAKILRVFDEIDREGRRWA